MTEGSKNSIARIPAVHKVLEHPDLGSYLAKYDRAFVVFVVQSVVDGLRANMLENRVKYETRTEILTTIVHTCIKELDNVDRPSVQKAINGTGIILHTGLGRAPLTKAAGDHLAAIASGYTVLEFDLATGKRGSRHQHVEPLLCYLTGAEAACVVNNNAAALFLALNTLSARKEVLISRGQLVEIGGSFRVPEIMEKSGAIMREIGTTNKTHLRDYQSAIGDNTGLICLIHPSNYRVQGFTAEVRQTDLVDLARQHDLPVLQDLGGGILFDLQQHGLPYEPVVRDSIADGIDVVTFSGDKVLGGPQCGILAGKHRYISALKHNPLMRVLRCDKLTYAALETTLKQYVHGSEIAATNMVFQLMLHSVAELRTRAEAIIARISTETRQKYDIQIKDTGVQVGSGAMPLEKIDSVAITIYSRKLNTERLARQLRAHRPPLIGYIRDNRLFFDVRTIFPEEDVLVMQTLQDMP
jgi:L-seryl-tRNA(Ser) seleniumtransferase